MSIWIESVSFDIELLLISNIVNLRSENSKKNSIHDAIIATSLWSKNIELTCVTDCSLWFKYLVVISSLLKENTRANLSKWEHMLCVIDVQSSKRRRKRKGRKKKLSNSGIYISLRNTYIQDLLKRDYTLYVLSPKKWISLNSSRYFKQYVLSQPWGKTCYMHQIADLDKLIKILCYHHTHCYHISSEAYL